METAIRIKDLNVFAGKTQILHDINVEIPKNKITVILGPSGCGKTTLLKCMNRLTDLYPELKVSGEILINDKNIFDPGADISKLRQSMGLLSQRPYPLPMTIYNNIAYALKLRGVRGRRKQSILVMDYLKQANLYEEVRKRLTI